MSLELHGMLTGIAGTTLRAEDLRILAGHANPAKIALYGYSVHMDPEIGHGGPYCRCSELRQLRIGSPEGLNLVHLWLLHAGIG